MRRILILVSLLFSVVSYGQLPNDFRVLYFADVDTSVLILSKMVKQQKNPPISVEVNNESITQNRTKATVAISLSVIIPDNLSHYTSQTSIFYENITSVEVEERANWRISYKSKVTKQSDVIVLNDKEMAEKAYAALLCLIRHSGSKYYDEILKTQIKEY